MGRLCIEPITRFNEADAKVINGTFIINSRLLLLVSPGSFHYEIISIAVYEKRYRHVQIDPKITGCNLRHASRCGFLAYLQNRPAGLILISEGWNRMAVIDDTRVDISYRRQGIAISLLKEAEIWARQRSLRGLRLETQDTNVAACQLYEHCGFVLSGLDRSLYVAIPDNSHEIALFWYRLFSDF